MRIEEGPVTGDRIAAIEAAFHETYEREYTYRLGAPVEMVGIHLVAAVEVGKLTMVEHEPSGAGVEAARKDRREVDYALEGVHRAAIYDGERLEAGMTFAGPRHRRGPLEHGGGPPPATRSRSTATANLHIRLEG